MPMLCNRPSTCVLGLLLVIACSLPPRAAAVGEQSGIDVWASLLRPKYFEDRPIEVGQSVIAISVPKRAEDSGVVAISIHAGIPQAPERYIDRLYVFVDKNPRPLAGVFELTQEMGRADLAMRLRVNEYSHVRVVAQTNDGKLYMDSAFTRASGGCTDPPPFLQLKAARERIGEMKLRTRKSDAVDGAALAQLIVSHPNVTGMQLDQRTRTYIPEEYMTKVIVTFNDKHVLSAETDISISEDPSFRFFFKPATGGTLTARMFDSKGREIAHSFPVEGI